jgi:hypothetical protein
MTGLKNLSHIFSITVAATLLSHCASSQQGGQQSSDQVAGGDELGNTTATNASLNGGNGMTPNNKSAMGEQMNNAVSGGSSNNFSGSNGGNLISNSALGESLNNVPINNPAAASATPAPLNAPLNQAATPLNQSATNLAATGLNSANTAAPSNAVAPVNAATTPETAAPAPVNEVKNSNARADASPFKNPQMNWPGKGKVKYATRSITRHASPNGPVVGEFEQGEHPLVYQNGNWVELNDGSFVKGNGLSDKAVGYDKGKANWR